MKLPQIFEDNMGLILLAVSGLAVILFILVIIILIKQRRLNKRYKKFMGGQSGKNLEELVQLRFAEIDILKEDSKKVSGDIWKLKENIELSYQKIGVVKYDAFKEMGGKLSFVLALLDKNDNGILLNSVHSSREGCYTYLKEIIKGESFLELSEDEKSALKIAVNSTNYMS